MSTFAVAARASASSHCPKDEIDEALRVLGAEAEAPLTMLSSERQASLADRFVRNLKSLGVHQATHLEHDLLGQLHAQSSGPWTIQLDGALSNIELRNQLRFALTALGLGWDALSRVQASIAVVTRWIQSRGAGSVEVTSADGAVSFRIATHDQQLTPSLVEDSPLVRMLRECVQAFRVQAGADGLELSFRVTRA